MKTKALAITATLLLSALVSLSMLNQVQAESFTATWVGHAFHGTDSFYKETVVAYESGSTAVLYVSVTHNYSAFSGKQINVSAVGINPNWGDPINSTQANKTNPVALNYLKSQIFTITFVVLTTANVSNLFRWDYEIYVEHIIATGAVVPLDVKTREECALPYFVVYSAKQADSRRINKTIEEIKTVLGTPVVWNSAKAGILWKRAMNETGVAEYYYESGEFSNSATHYENALSLINDAFTAEEAKTRGEDAEITLLEAKAKWFEGWSNFFNGLSNMWTLIGVALVLFALGYIIRGLVTLRKKRVPP